MTDRVPPESVFSVGCRGIIGRAEAVDALAGWDKGWTRYLDSHLGVSMMREDSDESAGATTLDANAAIVRGCHCTANSARTESVHARELAAWCSRASASRSRTAWSRRCDAGSGRWASVSWGSERAAA